MRAPPCSLRTTMLYVLNKKRLVPKFYWEIMFSKTLPFLEKITCSFKIWYLLVFNCFMGSSFLDYLYNFLYKHILNLEVLFHFQNLYLQETNNDLSQVFVSPTEVHVFTRTIKSDIKGKLWKVKLEFVILSDRILKRIWTLVFISLLSLWKPRKWLHPQNIFLMIKVSNNLTLIKIAQYSNFLPTTSYVKQMLSSTCR